MRRFGFLNDVGFVREPLLLDLGAQARRSATAMRENRCGAGNGNDKRHYWLFPLGARLSLLLSFNKLKAQDDALQGKGEG